MTSDPDEELSFLSISEDFVPSTVPTPSQQVTLAFDGLLTPPLILQTNETQCGGKLWPAGMVLAEYLLRDRVAEVEGKTMFVRSDCLFCCSHGPAMRVYFILLTKSPLDRIELGAGSGLVGLALAIGLKHPTSSRSTKIHLTDGHPPLLPLLQHNIDLNKPNFHSSTSVVPNILSWGQPISPTIPTPPDIVLAADCCYLESNVPLLVNTMETLMGRNTLCYLCYKKRRRADQIIIIRLSKMFEVEEIKGKWDKDGVFLYEIKKRNLSSRGGQVTNGP